MLRKCVTAAVMILLFVVFVAAGLEAWFWFGRPPIIRDVTAGFFRHGLPDGKDVYRQRVHATFPIGIPETELLTSLAQHGYEVMGTRGLGPRYAHIHTILFPACDIKWSVVWRTDHAGIVSEVEGDIYPACL